MSNIFEPWKQYVLKNEEAFRMEENNQDLSDVVYIGETKIHLYSANHHFSAGIWLQFDDSRLLIYMRDLDKERIMQRSFSGEFEEGPVHQNDTIEIGYVVEGCAYQSFFGKEYQFKQGDFWIVNRNCYHTDNYRPANLFTVYVTIPTEVFDSAFLETVGSTDIQRFLFLALLEQKKNRQFLRFIPRAEKPSGEVLMGELVKEIIEKKVGYYNISKGLVARLLECLSSEYEFLLASQEKQKMNDLLFREIEKYIRENYRTVTIHELADRFHYNEDFYNRLIKAYSGNTYSSYLKNVRLLEAEKMLLSTKLPIDQIADLIGYQSRGNFYRLFTERYGMTPAKYRNKINE